MSRVSDTRKPRAEPIATCGENMAEMMVPAIMAQ